MNKKLGYALFATFAGAAMALGLYGANQEKEVPAMEQSIESCELTQKTLAEAYNRKVDKISEAHREEAKHGPVIKLPTTYGLSKSDLSISYQDENGLCIVNVYEKPLMEFRPNVS